MWNDLNMTQRNELIKLYLNNGISSLDKMKEHYNSYATGGSLDEPPNNPPFVKRFSEGQKRAILTPEGYATHRLSYAEDNGKYIVYPNVQPIDYNNPNSPLYDYEDDNWTAFDRALKNNDTLQFNTAKEAEEYTKHYKDFGREGYLLNIPSKINLPKPKIKFQIGGNIDNISSGRWVQVDNETITPEYSLPPVNIEAEHPLWSLPWYKDKKNNSNINKYKDQLYNNWRRRNEAGKEYLKRVAGGLSVMALPIGGAAGFILGVPDLATDFVEMIDKPSASNAAELALDAPTRYGTELDNALISVLESNKYTKPLAKILEYNDILQYIGAANDASTAITGKSIIEHASE